VFGGIAGDTIAQWTPDHGRLADPDPSALEDAVMRAGRPLTQAKGDIDGIRKRLYDLMWEDAGIIRDLDSLKRAEQGLDVLEHDLDATGVTGTDLAYNLTWHDWLNLKNLILVSKAITAAATARDDSRGAHYRADYPEVRDVENSRFTRVTLDGHGQIGITTEPVKFTRVKPGETLLTEGAAE